MFISSYHIPNFAKGLVDESSKGTLSPDYKQKCLELENFYIKANNTIAKRQGTKSHLTHLPGIIDIKRTEDRTVLLRRFDKKNLVSGTKEYEEALRAFMAWGSWLNAPIESDILNGHDCEYTILESYRDGGQGRGIKMPLESYLFVSLKYGDKAKKVINFKNSTDSFDYRLSPMYGFPSQVRLKENNDNPYSRSYSEILDQMFSQEPRFMFILTGTRGPYPPRKPIYLAYEYPSLNLHDQLHEIIDPKDQESIDALNNIFIHPSTLWNESEVTNLQPSFNPLISNTSKTINRLPIKLEQKHGKLGLTFNGLSYTWDKNLTCDNSSKLNFSSADLIESNMNTFSQKSTDFNIEKHKLYYFDINPTNPADIGLTKDQTPIVEDFDIFLDTNPEYVQIKHRLKSALYHLQDNSHKIPGCTNTTTVIPDIKITLPSTDASAMGTYLFTLDNGDNVFVGHSGGDILFKDREDANKNSIPPALLHASDNSEFPNNNGVAIDSYGVTLWVQRGNIKKQGSDPKIHPIPDKNTIRILRLFIDPTNILRDVNLLSFYASRGTEGFESSGFTKVSNPYNSKSFKAYLESLKLEFVTLKDGSTILGSQYIPNSGSGISEKLFSYATIFASKMLYQRTQYNPISIYSTISEIPDIANNDVFKNSAAQTQFMTASTKSSLDAKAEEAKLKQVLKWLEMHVEQHTSGVNGRVLRTSLAYGAKAELFSASQIDTNNGSPGDIKTSGGATYYSGRNRIWGVRTKGNYGIPSKVFMSKYKYSIWGSVYPDSRLWNDGDYVQNIDRLLSIISSFGVRHGSRSAIFEGSGSLDYQRQSRNHGIPISEYGLYWWNPDNVKKTFGGEEFSVSRDPKEDNFYEKVLENVKRRLASANLKTGDALRPYSTEFITYELPTDNKYLAGNRILLALDNNNNFSSLLNTTVFSHGYKQFLNNVITTGNSTRYLKASDLGNVSFYDTDINNPHNADQITLFDKHGEKARTVDFIERLGNNLLVTTTNILKVTNLGGSSPITFGVEISSGLTSPVADDSSTYIGGDGSKLKILRYFERIGGYTSEIINKELTFDSDVMSVVSLLERHKLILVLTEYRTLYTLSMGDDRSIKGFSKFTFSDSIIDIKKLSEDHIALLNPFSGYLTLDFGLDLVHGHESNFIFPHADSFSDAWAYMDERVDGGPLTTYPCILKTMPILQLTQDAFSPTSVTQIRNLTIGLSGHPAFKLEIIGERFRDKNINTIATRNIRNIDKKNITKDVPFSGQFMVGSIPLNGSSQPILKITKDDDEYLEIASLSAEIV